MKINRLYTPKCQAVVAQGATATDAVYDITCMFLADYSVTLEDGTVRYLCCDHAVDEYGMDAVFVGNNAA